jgi:hypothetical protein
MAQSRYDKILASIRTFHFSAGRISLDINLSGVRSIGANYAPRLAGNFNCYWKGELPFVIRVRDRLR